VLGKKKNEKAPNDGDWQNFDPDGDGGDGEGLRTMGPEKVKKTRVGNRKSRKGGRGGSGSWSEQRGGSRPGISHCFG